LGWRRGGKSPRCLDQYPKASGWRIERFHYWIVLSPQGRRRKCLRPLFTRLQ
jgi:hypothetical protein